MVLGADEVGWREVEAGVEDGVEGIVENLRQQNWPRKVKARKLSKLLSGELQNPEQEMDGDEERRRGSRRTPSCRLSCPPNRRPPLLGITTDTKNCKLPVRLLFLDNH